MSTPGLLVHYSGKSAHLILNELLFYFVLINFPSGVRVMCLYSGRLIAAVFCRCCCFGYTVAVQMVRCPSVYSFFLVCDCVFLDDIRGEDPSASPVSDEHADADSTSSSRSFFLRGILAATFQVFPSHRRGEDL